MGMGERNESAGSSGTASAPTTAGATTLAEGRSLSGASLYFFGTLFGGVWLGGMLQRRRVRQWHTQLTEAAAVDSRQLALQALKTGTLIATVSGIAATFNTALYLRVTSPREFAASMHYLVPRAIESVAPGLHYFMKGTLDHIRTSSLKTRQWFDSSSVARWFRSQPSSATTATAIGSKAECEKEQLERVLREIRGAVNEESHTTASATKRS